MNQLGMFDASLGVVVLPEEEFVWIGGQRMAMTGSLRVSMELQKSVPLWLRGCGWSLHENFDYEGVAYRCVNVDGQRTRVWQRLVDAVSEAEGMEWRQASRVPAGVAASVNGDVVWRRRLEEVRPLGLAGAWPLDAVTLEDWLWYRAKSQVLEIRRAVGVPV